MIEKANSSRRKAVVIGASMSGLLAAAALARHFERVVAVETDRFPQPGENRKGVPQGRHVHVLLDRGRRIMESLLPGLTADLLDLGAAQVRDTSQEVRWFHTGYHQPGRSNLRGVGVSRPTLEACVRQHVTALENVEVREGRRVSGLLSDPDRMRVTGVTWTGAQGDEPEASEEADLVVDASGRGSRGPNWLKALGYPPPAVEELQIGLGYTTCFYRRTPDQLPGLQALIVLGKPPIGRFGVIVAQDGGRWVVTLGGYAGEHAPTDYNGFLAFAEGLPTPDLHDAIKDAEPLTDPVSYNYSANLRRRYERLTRFPQGYLVTGDALCSFNPIYGQGMTVAAIEAESLDASLGEGDRRLARRFFRRAKKTIDVPWSMVIGNDSSMPGVEGRRPLPVRFINWYLGKLHVAASTDSRVSIAFLKVSHMEAPPPIVFHPRIAWRILKGNLARRRIEADGADLQNDES